ncbi:hypothetical protein Hanom_Chr07g00638851 [Helianthus anomalus]
MNITLTLTRSLCSSKSVKGWDDLKVIDRGRQHQSTASKKVIRSDVSSWASSCSSTCSNS